MSDGEAARDARIREIVAQFPGGDLAYLVARIAVLEAENARMRAVAAAMAKHPMTPGHWTCPFCKAPFAWNEGTGVPMDGTHAADCPVTIARAILASASDGGTTNEPEGRAGQ